MMKKFAVTTIVVFGVAAATPSAFAQCPPGSWLCADITVQTAPPPIVVQTPPPPVVYIEPPPPIIVVQPPPPPPPIVVYQTRPVYVQQAPTYVATTYGPPPPPAPLPPRQRRVGLQGQLVGALIGSPAGTAGMGGLGAALRFRSAGYLGGELALNGVWGRDYNGDKRTEIPLTFSGLFFFNPQSRFQVYGLLGLGLSVADVTYSNHGSTYAAGIGNAGLSNADAHGRSKGTYTYLGAQAGIGFEFEVSPRFALFADLRGFIRGRVDDGHDANPEFARINPSTARTQTSNGSVGSSVQGGAVLYF